MYYLGVQAGRPKSATKNGRQSPPSPFIQKYLFPHYLFSFQEKIQRAHDVSHCEYEVIDFKSQGQIAPSYTIEQVRRFESGEKAMEALQPDEFRVFLVPTHDREDLRLLSRVQVTSNLSEIFSLFDKHVSEEG